MACQFHMLFFVLLLVLFSISLIMFTCQYYVAFVEYFSSTHQRLFIECCLMYSFMSFSQDNNINNPTEIIFEMSKDERKDFYRTVAKGLNRPLFSVYRRVIRMYDKKNYVGKYSQDEMIKLRELVSFL